MRRLIGFLGMVVLTWSALATALNAQPPGQGPRGGAFGPMRLPAMSALDANNDGELSAEEIAGAAESLKKLDRNQDGRLTRDELGPPMGDRGRQGGPGEPRRMEPRPGAQSPAGRSGEVENAPLAGDEAEQKILKSLQEIAQEQGRMLNVPVQDGRLLRLLVEAIDAKKVVEFGTSNGISGIWIGNALRKTGGKLITHEIQADVAALARKNFARAGVAEFVTVVEGDGHEKAAELEGPIDLVFIDADKEGYPDYLRKTLPLVRPGGLIVAHNVNPQMASSEYVKAVTTDPALETVFYTEGGGISVTLKKR